MSGVFGVLGGDRDLELLAVLLADAARLTSMRLDDVDKSAQKDLRKSAREKGRARIHPEMILQSVAFNECTE